LKFNRVHNGYWKNKSTQREFMEYLGKQLNLQHMDEWYKVTTRQISEKGGGGLLRKYNGSPANLIMSVYDDHKWFLRWFKK